MLVNSRQLKCDSRAPKRRVRNLAATVIVMVWAQLLPLALTPRPTLASAAAKPKTPVTARVAPRFEASRRIPGFLPQEGPARQQRNGIQNPFLQLFPELSQGPAPDCLHQGRRVTYRVETANIQQTPDDPRISGASLVQYELVALDDQDAIASAKSYVVDFTNNAVIPCSAMISQGMPGGGCSYREWLIIPLTSFDS